MSIDPTTLTRTLPVPGNLPGPSRFPAGTSEWWIDRMSRALLSEERIPRFQTLDAYYRGENQTSRLASQAYRESGLLALFPNLNANHSKLIVNAAAQRLVILGFRLAGDLRADTAASEIWKRNQMDAISDQAHTESLVKGECPVLVTPGPDGAVITPQDPEEVIVWHGDRDRRIRLAAMKTWWDADARRRVYTLYFPDRIERWQDRDPSQMDMWLGRLFGAEAPKWERRGSRDLPAVESNPLGEVPVVVIPNDPRLSDSPEGEHEPALTLNDLYNFTLMNMAHTAKELGFPQRYGIGVEDAGDEPALDANGVPIVTAPGAIRNTPSDMITTPTPDASFGQFAAASLDGFVKALDTIRADEATITFTPYHFLLNMPTSVPPSGESITAAEAALVDKVRGHQRDKGAAWREILRLAFLLEGDETRARAASQGKVIWSDPERRGWSQHIDGLSKLLPLGAPKEGLWELIPLPPEEIVRWQAMAAEEAAAAPGPASESTPGEQVADALGASAPVDNAPIGGARS